nr:hypothetical protein [Tanacetum cinerariifolium]
MLNKEKPWSSRLLRYAKSRPNGKLIHNSIINGPYVRQMIPEPGDTNREVLVNETFHIQTDDELTKKELNQIEADDQAIQTILLGLPEDIYAAVDSCKTAQEIWLRPEWIRHVPIVHQTKDLYTADYTQLYEFLKYSQKENVGNQNGLIGVPGNGNQNGNGNLVAARAEGNTAGHNVPQNDNNVISKVTSVEQSGERVEQHHVNFEETRALYDSLYHNLAIEVEKVNSVNRKLKETNADLTTELARFKNQEKCFEISQEKYDKLERCYQQSVYQEQCLSKKLNALHLSTAKFVGDFKSLAKEADASLAKHKALELEIERLLRAVVSQDIMSVVQNNYVVDISNLQTELERMKERFENCIIKKENEYAKLWNDWYKRAQLFKKVFVQKDNTRGTRKNIKFAKQSILGKPPMLGEIHALSKPITSNSVPTPQESKVRKNDKVISPGMFRINPFKTSREEKHVPNNIRASARTKPITASQPRVFTKKDVNSDSNGLSFTGIDNTKTRRPQPRSNTKKDSVPSVSKSSQSKNK